MKRYVINLVFQIVVSLMSQKKEESKQPLKNRPSLGQKKVDNL